MTTLLVVALFLGAAYLVTKAGRLKSRRSAWRRWLARVVVLINWFQTPRWTPTLRMVVVLGGALVLFGVLAWYSGQPLLSAAAVVAVGAVVAVQRAVRWVLVRREMTLDAGLPWVWWRVLKDAATEQQKFSKHREKWAEVCAKHPKLHNAPLRKMQLTLAGDVKALVDFGAVAGDLDALLSLTPTVLPGAFRCTEVSVVQGSKPGTAWVTFMKSSPLERVVPIAELAPSGRDAISFGVHDDGSVAAIPYGLSVLVGAATNGGKSGFNWSTLFDIRRDDVPIQLHIVDPKNAELSRFKELVGQRIGNIQIVEYVRTGTETKAMFDRLVQEMHDRQQRLAALGLRKLETPTEEFPAVAVYIDELMDVAEAFKGGATSPMGIYLSQSRATKEFVIASAQLAKVSTLGDVRDLFPVRAAMRTMTPENTKAILGVGETEGALCSRIPLNMPGVGYYVTDAGIMRKFRTAYVRDEDVDTLISGRLPEGMLTQDDLRGTPTWLYCAPDKLHSRQAYAGITNNLRRRFAEHRRDDFAWCAEHEKVENWWKVHVDEARMVTTLYPSERAARAAEARWIREKKPHFNIVHNSGHVLSNAALAGKDRRAGRGFRARDAGREWLELGRDELAVHHAKKSIRHSERVERIAQQRERFVETVTAGGWTA